MPKAAFLDRDGIINVDKGYVHRVEDFIFVPGIFSLCRSLTEKDFQLIVVTNQSGIGRGLFTPEAFDHLNQWMLNRFQEEGITIQGVFLCPHHPTEGKGEYQIVCSCRKPAPGLIFQATDRFRITLDDSILIGDKPSDILAGINAGIPKNYLISTEASGCLSLNPCQCFGSLEELTQQINKL